MKDGVSIIIPTFNGGEVFKRCIEAIQEQNYSGEKQIIIIDSGSTDGTCESALKYNCELININSSEFHHSRTRNNALKYSKYDKVVYLVQDAIPMSNNWLEKLINSIDGEIVGAYGQQIPHVDADTYARFEVEFHGEYLGFDPVIQSIESLDEFKKLSYGEALKKIRFDNVCAIYSKEKLLETPFPDVLFGEDIAWSYEVLKKGYKVMYQPEVKVYHSHNRKPEYRFKRAIIDTIVCSELLEKIDEDLSFYNYKDLLLISKEIDNIKERIYKQSLNSLNKNENYENQKAANQMSYIIKKFIKKLYNKYRDINQDSIINKKIDQMLFEKRIKLLVDIVKSRYIINTNSEMYEIIDQACNSVKGTTFGKVYSSYKLKGEVPENIENLILPNIKGV